MKLMLKVLQSVRPENNSIHLAFVGLESLSKHSFQAAVECKRDTNEKHEFVEKKILLLQVDSL